MRSHSCIIWWKKNKNNIYDIPNFIEEQVKILVFTPDESIGLINLSFEKTMEKYGNKLLKIHKIPYA